MRELQAVLGSGEAQPPTTFAAPAGLERRRLCDLSSVVPDAPECSFAGEEWFLTMPSVGTTPTPDPALVQWERIEPAVWRAPALLLPPELQVSSNPDQPPQFACPLPQGADVLLLPPQTAPQLFLAPPRNPESRQAAAEWAAEIGLVLLPPAACGEDVLVQAVNGAGSAVYRITSPRNGDEVSGILPILGVASFDPQEVRFYKIELGRGDLNNPEWVTLGETRSSPVINGELEQLYASGLPAGEYLLRLILVTNDGNYVGEPYTIRITVTGL